MFRCQVVFEMHILDNPRIILYVKKLSVKTSPGQTPGSWLKGELPKFT